MSHSPYSSGLRLLIVGGYAEVTASYVEKIS